MFQKNKSQEEASSCIYGPVIIVACPGSGKTTTLIRRIHSIVESGADPKKILMVTFTKAAAEDMAARYRSIYGKNPGVVFATIHSLCFHILQEEGVASADSLISERDKYEFVMGKLRSYMRSSEIFDAAFTIISEISYVKNNAIPIHVYKAKSLETEVFRAIYCAYEQMKEDLGKIDFDDMLLLCDELFQDKEEIKKKWQNRFDFVQCDEYQDVNVVQRDILYALSGRTRNLCVVGDDDQSIYAFRGASSKIMLNFANDFPDAKEIYMSTNYRCAGEIVTHANLLIQKNKVRFAKDFVSFRGQQGTRGKIGYAHYSSKTQEMSRILAQIESYQTKGFAYQDMAIIFRNNRQAEIPARALMQAKIPFHSTERIKSIYEGWIFEDMKTYALLSAGKEKSFLKVLNRPSRYLSPSDFVGCAYNLEEMQKRITAKRGEAIWKYENRLESILLWMRLFGPGKLSLLESPQVLFDRMFSRNGIKYLAYIKKQAALRNEHLADYMEEIEELKKDALRFGNIEEWFLHASKILYMTGQLNKEKTEDGISLTTMHRSKGMEWKIVFVIGVNEGICPSRKCEKEEDYEEERRLFYVAVTRAKDICMVSSTGTESYFVEELKGEEDKKPVIQKKLAGTPIIHKTRGEGRVSMYTDREIWVLYPTGDKQRYAFPDAFLSKELCYK